MTSRWCSAFRGTTGVSAVNCSIRRSTSRSNSVSSSGRATVLSPTGTLCWSRSYWHDSCGGLGTAGNARELER
ncbi:hypothetical protein SSPIM334S_04687 [Streptomyces spiroverticillatus]|uniref:hypothetical protein n=1 Tax=Streptomyces finlayi TaxID=67296 RepID=UPI001E3880CF|nr:hypothetical protein [Streptomyces finlayi]